MRPVALTVLFVSLCLPGLTGCGSAFKGSLTEGTGGSGPVPASGQADITSVSPSTIPADSAAFTLTVTGTNFIPSTAVLWDNNTTLVTTYVSATALTAQVPASLLTRPATISIDPSPLQSLNFGATFTVGPQTLSGNPSFSLSHIAIPSNDLEWDPVSKLFYLSVAAASGTDPKSLTALDPATGLPGATVSTGTEPGKIAVSTNGAFLYAGLDSTGSIQRYTLPTLQTDIAIPLGSNTYGPFYAIDIQPEPGSAHSIAVSRGSAAISPREEGGVVIYDDAVARAQSVPGFGSAVPTPIDALLWNPDATDLYGLDTETGSGVSFMSVTSAGVQFKSSNPNGGGGFLLHFDPVTGYLYNDNGAIIDPVADTTVATFPTSTVQNGFSGGSIMVPDGTLNIAYFMGQTQQASGPGVYVIEAYDLTHFTLLGAIPVTGISGTPVKLVRWGGNGLAILCLSNATAEAGDGVYLLSGAFVTSPAAPPAGP